MGLQVEHEIHRRRRGRNMGLGLVLIAFVALVFGLSVVKIKNGGIIEGYDHQPRTSDLPLDPAAPLADPPAAPVAAPGTPAAARMEDRP